MSKRVVVIPIRHNLVMELELPPSGQTSSKPPVRFLPRPYPNRAGYDRSTRYGWEKYEKARQLWDAIEKRHAFKMNKAYAIQKAWRDHRWRLAKDQMWTRLHMLSRRYRNSIQKRYPRLSALAARLRRQPRT